MMSNDLLTQLADYGRYHREAQRRIQPEDVGIPLVTLAPRQSPKSRWLVPAVTVVAVVGLLAALALFATKGIAPTSVMAASPAGVPEGAPPPGSVAPYVETPPAWFGEPLAGERSAAERTGRWVSTAIGIEGDGRVNSPIVVAVTEGNLNGLEDADEIAVDGKTLRSLAFGEWQALATVDQPTIVVSGAVDTDLLADVLNATTVVATPAGDSLSLGELPPGYAEQVAPQLHAADVPDRRTVSNAAGDTSINEISDWVEPELAAAASGADYQLVDINGTHGWTGRTEFNSYGPLTFLVWSPQPGVVFEIVTTTDQRNVQDLIELAAVTQAMTSSDWDQRFGN